MRDLPKPDMSILFQTFVASFVRQEEGSVDENGDPPSPSATAGKPKGSSEAATLTTKRGKF